MNRIFKLTGFLLLAVLFSFTTLNNKKIIIIDAGHGGQDLGVNKDGINEKDIVLDLAKRIQKANKNKNVEIILTRNSDEFKSLSQRTELGNKIKPAMILSLHVYNSTNVEKNGFVLYAKPEHSSLSKKLATKFDHCDVLSPELFLLRNSESPALYLELGYMSNQNDRNYLDSESGKSEITQKITAFISEI